MATHRHVFKAPGQPDRELPTDVVDPVSGALLRRVVGSFQTKGQANGGVTDLAGEVSAAELTEFPDVYVEGCIWTVYDDDDPLPAKSCRGWGRLDAPIPNADGSVTLHGEGPCRRVEQDSEARRTWQSRGVEEVTPEDTPPFDYTADEQIEAGVQGQNIVLGWGRKQAFIRATGAAELAHKVKKGDATVDLDINGGGLVAGEWISIGNETKKVKNTYSPGSTNVPLKTKLDHDHDAGARVQWRASGGPEDWRAGVVDWRPGMEITRVAGDFQKNRHPDGTRLYVMAGQGPDNANTQVANISMDNAGPGDFDITGLPANTDCLRFRLVRTKADEKTEAFHLEIHSYRVNDLAGNDDVYEAHKIVEDVAGWSGGGDLSGIVDSAVNALPAEAEGVPSSKVLDDMAILTKRYWSVEYNGTEFEWFFRAWGTKRWVVTDPNVGPSRDPLPRKNVAVVPFRWAEGGVQHFTKKRATPDPFPGESRAIVVPLEEPLPFLDIADAVALNVADLAAEERFAVRAAIITVEADDNPGVEVPAGRMQVGDAIEFPHHGGAVAQLQSYEYDDDGVMQIDSTPATTGETGIPAVDAVLARRVLYLARGRGNPWASLHEFDLDDPLPPLDMAIDFDNTETRNGRRRYDLIVDWSPVLEDINGKGTAIQSYDIEIQPLWNDTQKPVDKRKGGGIRRRHLKPRKENDAVDDAIPTRVLIESVPNAREWAWQARGMATDIFGKKSEFTEWAPDPAVTPVASAPRAVENLVADIDQQRLKARWERFDDTLGEGSLQGANLLSVDDTGLEAAGSWVLGIGAGAGSALSRVTDAAYEGDWSFRLTAPTAGGEAPAMTGLYAVTGGKRYNVRAWAVAETIVRNTRVGLHFYTAADVYIGTVWGATETHLTIDGFQELKGSRLLAPATAAKARAAVSFLATASSAERFFFDEVTVREIPTTPLLDREVAYFRWYLIKAGTTIDQGRTRATHLDIKVKRPGAAVHTLEVVSVNADGDISATASTTTSKLNPPTPVAAPSVTISADDSEAGQREANVSFWYTTTGGSGGADLGGEGQYADDDVDRFVVEAQTADNAAFTKKVKKLPRDSVNYEGLVLHETTYKPIRKGRHFRARYIPVDTRGHKGTPSSWS